MTIIHISGETLAAMYDNGMCLWVTPGDEDNPYWDSQQHWMNDYSVGDAADVLEAWNAQVGDCLSIDDIRDEGAELTIEIETAFVPEGDE